MIEEEPMYTSYKGIEAYKTATMDTQGPAMLQCCLNILGENFDLKGMDIIPYIHTLYQAMNLAFGDRDFISYGDLIFHLPEPMKGFMSKEYAKARAQLIDAQKMMQQVQAIPSIRRKKLTLS